MAIFLGLAICLIPSEVLNDHPVDLLEWLNEDLNIKANYVCFVLFPFC